MLPQQSVPSEPRSNSPVVGPRPQSLPPESEIDLPESAPEIRKELNENEPTVDLMQQDLPVRGSSCSAWVQRQDFRGGKRVPIHQEKTTAT